MYDKCNEDADILCGCYGKRDSCNCDVNRGSDGWKCMDCQEWLCDDCKNESECSRCSRKVESSEDDKRDSDSSTEENSIITDYLKSDEWVNPYSVLIPPVGVLGFLKIKHSTDIFLFIACKIRKYLILYKKQEI